MTNAVNGNGSPRTLNYGPEPTEADTRRVADVCVIGSGASGAIAASTLRRAGLDVVVVEQGPYVDANTSYDDIVSAAELAWVCQDNGLWAQIGYPWSTSNVGGGTVFYGGVSFRHRTADFDPERYLGPAEVPLRWPWTPDELAPYYGEVERLIGVAGGAGDPALPADHRYPLPPVPTSPAGQAVADAARDLGLTPFPTPLAVATRNYQGRDACTVDQPCISHQCPRGAKGDVFTVLLKPLLDAGELRLFAGLKAVRLVSAPGGRVTAVDCLRVDTGRRFRLPARQFVLAGNAIQSAALLLRSADEHRPGGLGNENDLVGRGLCMKLSEYVVGYRRVPEGAATVPPRRGPGPFSTTAVTDYYVAEDAPGGLGGLIYEAGGEEHFTLRPDEQIIRLECLVPDEPRLANRVTFGRGTDRHGLTDLVLEYQAHPRDLARLEYVVQRAEDLLRAAGCTLLRREPSLWFLGSTHLHGTCRSGTDPRTSVTDPDGKLHTVDNVTVVDGAVLPFPGAVNPTLTIQTLALRATHQLLRREFRTAAPAPTTVALPLVAEQPVAPGA